MTHRKSLTLLAVLMATAATGSVFAATPADAAAQKPATRMDANGDGVIDRQEAASRPFLAQRFDQLDKDKDGKLSREELPRWHARGGEHHRGMKHHHRGHRGNGFMAMMDSDHDGRISAAENKAFFERMDINKDGFVDRADREARMQQRRQAWFNAADTDKDGKLSPAELDAARSKHGQRGNHGPRPAQAPAAK